MTLSRRLAAILAADIAGYSRLIGADESGTLRQLRRSRAEVIDPTVYEPTWIPRGRDTEMEQEILRRLKKCM